MIFSVVVPTYNYGHFLRDALESIKKQTYDDWECIVVDDGSTDDTASVVFEYTSNDSRFRYFYQENGGLSSARNLGIAKSKGRFIQLLDADDYVHTRKFEFLAPNLLNENVVVYGDAFYFDSGNPEFLENWYLKNGLSLSNDSALSAYDLVLRNRLPVNAPIIPKLFFQKYGLFDEKLMAAEDWDLWLRFVLKNEVLRHVPGEYGGSFIRSHSNSMMSNSIVQNINRLKVRRKLHAVLSKELRRVNSHKMRNTVKEILCHQEFYKENIAHNYLDLLHSLDQSLRLRLYCIIYKLFRVKSFGIRLAWILFESPIQVLRGKLGL
ncbi:MAG: glycosyltransferase [Cyclobacteriaceae bacterium]